MANIGRLGVVLGLNTAEFVTGLQKASGAVLNFVDKMKPALLAGAAGFVALTAKALQYADEVVDVAKANEVATGSVIGLSKALAASGGKSEDVGKLLGTLTNKIDGAAQGSVQAVEAFERIGISMKDISNLDNEDIFNKTIQQLAGIQDPVQRNALAFQVFGRSIRGVDIKQLANDVEGARDKFYAQGEQIEKAAQLVDDLTLAFKNLLLEIAVALGDKLKLTFDYISKLTKGVDVIKTVFATVYETVAILGANVYFVFEQIIKGIGAVYEAGALAVQGDFAGAKDIFKNYNEQAKEARKNLDQFEGQVSVRSFEGDQPGDFPVAPGEGTKTPVKRQIQSTGDRSGIRSAQELGVAYAQNAEKALLLLQRQAGLVQLTERQREVAEAIFKIDDERDAKIAEIQKKIGEELLKSDKDKTDEQRSIRAQTIKELENQLDYIAQVSEAYKELTVAQIEANQEAQRSFGFGWDKAFRDFADNASNEAMRAKDIFNVFTNGMSSAIDQFVETGKFKFKEFTISIIQDLLKIQIKAQAAKIFSSLGGGDKGGGDFFGGVKKIFGFAGGGSPPVGIPSLVGESGPELITPKQPSTIIPNGGFGATSNYVTYNINALDSQSFEQRLAQNPSLLYSITEEGRQRVGAGSF